MYLIKDTVIEETKNERRTNFWIKIKFVLKKKVNSSKLINLEITIFFNLFDHSGCNIWLKKL